MALPFGRMHAIELQLPDGGDWFSTPNLPNSEVKIHEASLIGNRFSSGLSFDKTTCPPNACPNDLSSDAFLEGGFYGPSANEAGGTFGFGEYFTQASNEMITGAGIWYAKPEDE